MKIIGTTKIVQGMKIVLISDVARKLKSKVGDKLVYYEDDKGKIVIEKT